MAGSRVPSRLRFGPFRTNTGLDMAAASTRWYGPAGQDLRAYASPRVLGHVPWGACLGLNSAAARVTPFAQPGKTGRSGPSGPSTPRYARGQPPRLGRRTERWAGREGPDPVLPRGLEPHSA